MARPTPRPKIEIARIVLLGPPASGKGTQGELLARALHIPHVSTGELLRRSIEDDGDPHGVRETVAGGGLVPDEAIEELMVPHLGDRFLLDGYPRSSDQAMRLDKLLAERGAPIQAALELRLADETLIARMALRADAEHRSDDRPDVFLRRLRDYNRDIALLREHYGPLLVTVDAEGEEGEVLDRVLAGLWALGSQPTAEAPDEDARLAAALLSGDEGAFAILVQRYGGSMLRLATMWVGRRAVAEEVVQETWLGILRGLDRFEGRSSLKTWMFRILANTAKKRAAREGRTVPFSSLSAPVEEMDQWAVEPERFHGQGDRWPGGWVSFPRPFAELPEERLESNETIGVVRRAIEALPPNQREVIRMRDVEGLGSADVCNVLGITETNQRVLLHRARARVRRALERHLQEARPNEGSETT